MISAAQYEYLKDELSERGYNALEDLEFDLEQLGYGAARDVYALDVAGREPSALKVVMLDTEKTDLDDQELEDAGQMIAELNCLTRLQGHTLVPRLVDWGGDATVPLWIEIERLTQELPGLSFPASFKRTTGVPWSIFRRAVGLTHGMRGRDVRKRHETVRDYVSEWGPGPSARARVFLQDLGEVVSVCDLLPGDLEQPDNWGFTADGEIKILDLGLAEPRPGLEEGRALKRRLMR